MEEGGRRLPQQDGRQTRGGLDWIRIISWGTQEVLRQEMRSSEGTKPALLDLRRAGRSETRDRARPDGRITGRARPGLRQSSYRRD